MSAYDQLSDSERETIERLLQRIAYVSCQGDPVLINRFADYVCAHSASLNHKLPYTFQQKLYFAIAEILRNMAESEA